MKKFNTISLLSSEILKNLEQLEYINMTAIQEITIPILLDGKDIIAQAKTGSGKTASFGIPIIENINTKNRNPQALILCPTRELADQVAKELRLIARYKNNLKILTLCGGTPIRPQVASLEQGGHILVGTAGRVQDHLSRETIYLKEINTLVLDEADRMVDMGFYDEIKKIISNIPKKRHTMLFSATYPSNIKKLAKEISTEPITLKADITHELLAIEEIAYEIDKSSKPESLLKLLKSDKPKSTLIFCNTKIETIKLTDFLRNKNFSAIDLQGDLDQREREEALLMFSNGSISILVATDVASRGLDVKNIELVVNYDIPHRDEIYTHRIGRTARAGARGKAITLYTDMDKDKLFNIAKSIKKRDINQISIDRKFIMESKYSTICIDGGKKNKVRAGDILGALSKNIGISSEQIGKIDIFDSKSFVAIDKKSIRDAFDGLRKGKIKGKKFRVWWL
ncbi:MAG: ATP-dependent RNA helicase DbpA [Sulfurovum sp.]|nr:ATP-dependent RNA helicase DbpA [Sulfurovaceae bacterium]